MKLKSGCIFWPQIYHGPEVRHSSLDRDLSCDVAVLGSGISGALAAHHLTREGIQTVMLDSRQPGHGSTAASTGLLQYEIDTPLVDLIEKLGHATATAAYRASVESVLAFEPLVRDLGDRCGLTPRPSLYLASKEKDVKSLKKECEARRAMKIDVSFLSRDEVKDRFNLSNPAALRSSTAFDVDPFRLTLNLIRKAVSRGLEVFCETRVKTCESTDAGMTLHCENGPRVTAHKVIFATGYETMDFLPADLCSLASTFALVSQPRESFPGWPERCLIWESARPYLYMRTTEDNRVIVGGEDVDVVDPNKRDRLLPEKTQTLLDRFAQMMPQIKIETDCAWAGTFGQTEDGLPCIGSVQEFPHAYFALGYGGNGITFSLLAAEILTNAILGRPDARAKLFRFDR